LNRYYDVNLSAASAKQPRIRRETAAACRERAAADLLASAARINSNQRARLEASAAIWTARGLMLQRAEDGMSVSEVRAALGDPASVGPKRL
jgi:hypothetical protein